MLCPTAQRESCPFDMPVHERTAEKYEDQAIGKRSDTKFNYHDVVCATLSCGPISCFIEGVKVQALVDTGSMRSFISKEIHTVIDYDNSRVDKTVEERCRSITGLR